MNSTWRRSLESPKERSERCLSGGMVIVVASWGSRWFRNAKYSWRIRESPIKTKWLCFPQNARYLRHRLVSLKHYSSLFSFLFSCSFARNTKNIYVLYTILTSDCNGASYTHKVATLDFLCTGRLTEAICMNLFLWTQ